MIIRSFFCNCCEHLNTKQCELCCGCNGQGKHWSPINKELFEKNPQEYIKNLILASSKD